MRNRLLVLGLVAGLYAGVSAQSWFPQSSGAIQPLRSVHFPSANIGFAVGFLGTIAKTVNGGNTWSVDYDTSFVSLQSVFCTSVTTCLATGDYGKVLRTTDGGATWKPQDSGKETTLYTVRCPSETVCYAATQSPAGAVTSVVKSTNGGASWTAQGTGSFKWPYFAVSCPSVDNCYLGGEARTVQRTTNGGTWAGKTSPPAPPGTSNQNLPVLSLACPAPTTCIAVGGGGLMAKTTDGMETWTNLATTTSTGVTLRSVFFLDANTGYIAGDSGYVLKTTNGGSAWTRMTTPSKLGYYGIMFPDATTGYAVGENGLISKFGTPTAAFSPVPMEEIRLEGLSNGRLGYSLPKAALVTLRVLDAGGKTLSFTRELSGPGTYSVKLPEYGRRGRFLEFRAGAVRKGILLD